VSVPPSTPRPPRQVITASSWSPVRR
jgi:hypothetical protein